VNVSYLHTPLMLHPPISFLNTPILVGSRCNNLRFWRERKHGVLGGEGAFKSTHILIPRYVAQKNPGV